MRILIAEDEKGSRLRLEKVVSERVPEEFFYLSILPVFAWIYNDLRLHCLLLSLLAIGVGLIWTVMHRRRTAQIRRTASDCEILRDRLHNILQHSREVLFGLDLIRGQFDYLSPSCLSLTGYTPDEIREMGIDGLLRHVHPDDLEKTENLIRKVSHNLKERDWQGVVDFRLIHRDGQVRFFSDHIHVVYDSTGQAVYLRGSTRDVTRIVRLEELLHSLEKKFQDSQKLAGLGLLASGIAHDFNNLMTVVLGNVELALLELGGSDDGSLDEIKKTALRASELANQMLVYTGKTALILDHINLSSVVREMGSLLDVSISKKVKIEYCLDEKIALICGDISQIRQMAMNLITNASESIGDRSGIIAISIHATRLGVDSLERTIPPGGLPPGRYVQLEVSDTGDGMNEEVLQKIFDPLFTTKLSGRGLGLTSVFNAVQRHNGAVTVQSEVGVGSVFRVYFPIEEQRASTASANEQADESDWHGYGTALIADDEEAICSITTALLERFGFRVLTASDGLETVDLYMEHAGDITLLLMDINMPRLNGIEAVQRIRHINPKIPVLFMSGYPREQVMERFSLQPHTNFIRKPFQNSELRDGLRNVMEGTVQYLESESL